MSRPTNTRANTTRIAAREREARAIELRKSGMSFEAISDELGLSGRPVAYRVVMRAMDRIISPGVEALRELENERLDTALAAVWNKVEKGDLEAIHCFLRICERRCKLFGLDAPVKVAPTTPDGTMPFSLNVMTPEEAVHHYREALERAIAPVDHE